VIIEEEGRGGEMLYFHILLFRKRGEERGIVYLPQYSRWKKWGPTKKRGGRDGEGGKRSSSTSFKRKEGRGGPLSPSPSEEGGALRGAVFKKKERKKRKGHILSTFFWGRRGRERRQYDFTQVKESKSIAGEKRGGRRKRSTYLEEGGRRQMLPPFSSRLKRGKIGVSPGKERGGKERRVFFLSFYRGKEEEGAHSPYLRSRSGVRNMA